MQSFQLHPPTAGHTTMALPLRSSSPRTAISTFSLDLMPRSVQPRELHPFSVHFSMETRNWIATICKVTDTGLDAKRHLQFSFHSEREAKKFCQAYSPPKVKTPTDHCPICRGSFTKHSRPHHCRNCGSSCCDKCSTRWCIRMLPKTFLGSANAITARVCRTCDWLSNAFCMALIQGKYDDALALYNTKNVNLRTSFADINREAMFPVHCAVMGGNLELLKWLIDMQLVPYSVRRDPRTRRPLSVQTSAGRTLIDIAMTGRVKLNILRYLVADKNLSISDAKDPKLAPRTLEAMLKGTPPPQHESRDADDAMEEDGDETPVHVIDNANCGEESLATIEDACILCCEKSMDSVLIPCGHQICCQECGKNLTTCPVCKVHCSVLRIFRAQ